ncbi:hypothetical protein ACFQ0I_13080 [Mariniflexile aquimaris]|uniref:Lipocalin-like protein n=1 Tax=Mariniflexile aquimaris TaxID=881009 RepID=A0ABW3BVS0_9FLAO
MKHIFKIFFLFIYISSFSQEKNSFLVGKWKMISIETHLLSYNTITDSLSYSEDFKKMIPEFLKKYKDKYKDIDAINEYHKKQNSNNYFVFNEDGSYLRITNNKITIDGKYKVKPSKQIIEISFKSSRNKIEKSSMKYSVKDDNLYLTLTFDDRKGKKIRPTNFILNKQLIKD